MPALFNTTCFMFFLIPNIILRRADCNAPHVTPFVQDSRQCMSDCDLCCCFAAFIFDVPR